LSPVASGYSALALLPILRTVRGATPYMRAPTDRLRACGPSATSVRPFDRRGLRYFHQTPEASLRLWFCRPCNLLRCALPAARRAFGPPHTAHRLSFPLRGTGPAFATRVPLAGPMDHSTWTTALRREASNRCPTFTHHRWRVGVVQRDGTTRFLLGRCSSRGLSPSAAERPLFPALPRHGQRRRSLDDATPLGAWLGLHA